jgi:hypothetical protein
MNVLLPEPVKEKPRHAGYMHLYLKALKIENAKRRVHRRNWKNSKAHRPETIARQLRGLE